MSVNTWRAIVHVGLRVIVIVAVVAGLNTASVPLVAEVGDGGTSMGSFRAACVKVDITPDTPQWLQGYGPRQSEGVHDRIYHRIAAMDDGTSTFYIVSSDICTISPPYYDAFCETLERETGIRPEQVWWATTHTHSAPHVGPQDLI